ncbi:hypothetical protein J7K93_10520 [bacterium]|nr:hypothetical protein [bacterium]
MNSKLTLQLDHDVIEKAKHYAQLKKQSLSGLVQNYFTYLTESQNIDDIEVSQNIKEISGVIQLEDNYDSKSEYKKHIMEKYS